MEINLSYDQVNMDEGMALGGNTAMWHHKTKLGTFWIVESEDTHQYYLGMDEDSIGCYKRLEDAIVDIRNQSTGYIRWDAARKPEVPEDVLHQWDEGEPENWEDI